MQYVVFALCSLYLSELALFLHSYGFEETPSSKVLREESDTWQCVCLLLSEYRGSFRTWILVCKGLRGGRASVVVTPRFMRSVESHRRHHLVPTSPCIGHSAVLHSLLTDYACRVVVTMIAKGFPQSVWEVEVSEVFCQCN